MPRSKCIPSYCLHKPTGQARVRIDGVDHYLGAHGSEESKRKYEDLVRKLIAGRAAGELKARVQVASDLTIHELVTSYLQFARSYYVKDGRQTSECGVIAITLRLLKERHGFELVTAFGPLKLLALRDQWAADGIVRKQVNHRIERVRRMFSWAVSRQLVPPAILEALKTVEGLRKGRSAAKEGRKVTPVPDGRVDAIMPHVPRQVAAMIQIQRLSGARPEEITILRTADIDTADPACWVYRPHRHKTSHHDQDRVVYLGPKAIEVIRSWLRADASEYLFQPAERMAELALERRRTRRTKVQPSQKNRRVARPRKRPGDRYTTASYRGAIFRGCDRAFPHPTLAGIDPKDLTDRQRGELDAWRKSHRWKPNMLMHAAATKIRRECGLETAKAVLGHANVSQTQIYAEKDAEAAKAAMTRFG